jgi:cyclohexanecarboxylate-CoA ligase
VVVPAGGGDGGDTGVTLAELTDHLRAAGLITRKLPERLELVDGLPRNPSGKILKFELQKRFAPAG